MGDLGVIKSKCVIVNIKVRLMQCGRLSSEGGL